MSTQRDQHTPQQPPDPIPLLETLVFVAASAVFLGVVFVLPLLSIARA